MLSDIYGEDKREKFLIIKSLVKDRGCIGIVYGKRGVGKKYVVGKVIDEIKKEGDISLFIDAKDNWHQIILYEIGIYENLGKEEFLLRFYEFLYQIKGRMFIVFNNSHLFSEKQFLEIVKMLGAKEKITVFFIGEEQIKQILNPINTGKISLLINFVFEIKPPEFEEFYRFFKEKYKNSLSKREIKKLFKISGGSIGEAVSLVESGTDLSKKSKLPYLIFVFVIAGASIYFFYVLDEKEKSKVIKDMKLPVEGSVEDSLPIKVKRKEFKLALNGIEEKLKSIHSMNIPDIKFYEKKHIYTVQVATFKNKENAERLKNKLLQEGLPAEVKSINDFFRVYLYTSDRNELEKVLQSLDNSGFKPIVKKVK